MVEALANFVRFPVMGEPVMIPLVQGSTLQTSR